MEEPKATTQGIKIRNMQDATTTNCTSIDSRAEISISFKNLSAVQITSNTVHL